MTYKDLLRRQMDKHVSRSVARHTESYKGPNDTFTALIKSPSEILATFEGKAMLCPPSRMFAPANKSYRTKYYEFHEDHDHDTNDCIDLRKEIKACIRMPKNDEDKRHFNIRQWTFSAMSRCCLRLKNARALIKQAKGYRVCQSTKIPGIIVSDNRKQFSNNPFREWCEELQIKQTFTSVAHPQANGQTEVTNRTMLQGLKARLKKAKGKWVEELPNILWAY
ncbi:reverse transcriptase domain-containing protein [Tanacetum coccineum]